MRAERALALVASLCALSLLGALQEPKPDTDTRAEHVFKNIQLFKGQPAPEIGHAMNFMTAALGVNCEFCHVRSSEGKWSFEKDDKDEKQTARKMILMTRKINEENFDGSNVVTCASCHNGRHSPVPVPPLPVPASSDKRPEGAPPTVEEILGGYEQALGGHTGLEAVKSRILRGTVTSRGKTQDLEIDSGGGRIAIVTRGPDGAASEVYDGTSGWMAGPHGIGPVREGPDLDTLKRASDLQGD